jgi:RNA polymerase sigma-70 factor, ECF subfamily
MVLDGTESELIEACRRGDPEGFRALFDLHKDRVYSIALHYANDESAALDIAQNTFLKLFSSIRTFRGEGSFEAWLYRIVVNSCVDQIRERRRLLPFIDRLLDSLRSSGETALEKLLRQEFSDQVRAAVGKLPPEQRIIVVLRYTEGLSYEEMAEVLGCARGTVASRLNRAHKALERRLAHLAKKGGCGDQQTRS